MLEENPLELFMKLFFNYFRRMSKVFGINVFKSTYRIPFQFYIVLFIVSFNTFVSTYTLIYYRNDLEIFLKCLCMYGIGLQGFFKYFVFVWYPEMQIENVQFMKKIFEINEKNKTNAKILFKYTKISNAIFKLTITLYAITGFVFISLPIPFYLLFNERTLMLGIYIPFLNAEDHYIYLTMYHMMLVLLGVCGSGLSDNYFTSTLITAYAISKVMKANFTTLNMMIAGGKHSNLEIKQCFRNILLQHREFRIYLRRIHHSHKLMCAIQFICTSFSMAIIIFTIFVVNWYTAYVYIMVQFEQLLLYSVLGTLFEIMNDEMIETICNSKWYLLPNADQKTLLLLLMESQWIGNRVFIIGGFVPMNVSTMISILKKMYSFTMMLFQFVD